MRRARGFTLLEVVVAIAILGMSLLAVFQLNAGAVAMHGYTKRLTVATLLARSKMTDLEQELYDKGFSVDDQEESGDFSSEGWSSFKWTAKIIAPKTDGVSPEQLMGAIFNLPMGAGGLSSLFGGNSSGAAKDGKSDSAASASSLPPGASAAGGLGAAGGLMQGQFTQMVDQLTKAVREVHLTVYWKDGKTTETVDVTTHLVAFGPGGDRNGASQTPADQAAAAAGAAGIDAGTPVGGH